MIAAAKVSAVVMVQATPEAEAICQKNQLSAVDLLRPFGNVEKAFDVTTVGEQYRLRKFAMRFVHTNEFKECEQQNLAPNTANDKAKSTPQSCRDSKCAHAVKHSAAALCCMR